jgi:hypothetical protein
MIDSKSSDAEVEAAYQAMVEREGGDYSQGGSCPRKPYDPTPPFVDPKHDNRPANKSHRFRPRLKKFDGWVAVQVHPEVIELFSESRVCFVYQCQVSWDGSNVMCTQGGIPYHELRQMFMEAACEVAHQEGRSRTLRAFIDDLKGECDERR